MGRAISPAPGSFKKVTAGVITISGAVSSATYTLSPAVDVSKCELRFLGCSSDNSSFALAANVVLTNSTTITATRSASSGTTIAAFELTELN